MSRRLKILVANDDGIDAEGIIRLARIASRLGEVWVCAPASQCSGMSQKLTIFGTLTVKEHKDFPADVRGAWSVTGTPADCVKLAICNLLPEKPDYVFSGINYGYNCGFDIAYSGTVGAAKEALMNGVPAIAFSSQHDGYFDAVDNFALPLAKELIALGQAPNEFWNINFPGCPLSELKGVLRDRTIAGTGFYENLYVKADDVEDGAARYVIDNFVNEREAAESSDVHAVLSKYISVGKVTCTEISDFAQKVM